MPSKLEATLINQQDYAKTLQLVDNSIPFHFIQAALKHHKDGLLEKIRLHLFEVLDGEKRMYCVLHQYTAGKSIKVLINTDVSEKEFVRSATFAIMDKIHPILNDYDQFYCSLIRRDIREAMLSHPLLSSSHRFQPMDEAMVCFYINDQQCSVLEKMNIELPNDYYFVELAEEHAKQICEEQISTGQSSEEFTALRLRNFPAVGVAYKPLGELAEKSGNLVCYEYSDGMGMISLLYCQPAHRGRRLATLVEQKISQRNVKQLKVRPFKGVSLNRPRVLQMTAKNELWSACVDEDQNEEHFYCLLFSKVELPKVVIYEN